MTPQQANDYSHLPKHPEPHPFQRHLMEERARHSQGSDLSPIALVIVTLFVVGVMLYASFYAGRMTAKRADDARIEQAWRTGYVLGGLCRQDPTMAACSPASLRSGGVL